MSVFLAPKNATGGVYLAPSSPPAASNPVYAVLFENGRIRSIRDSEIGTGKSPIVLYQGRLRHRVASEGSPVTFAGGVIRVIKGTESLKL